MLKFSSKEGRCKASLKFHLIPVGMTRIKRTTKTNVGKDGWDVGIKEPY